MIKKTTTIPHRRHIRTTLAQWAICGLLLPLCFLFPRTARAAETIAWVCTPGNGGEIALQEKILHSLTFTPQDATVIDNWTTWRIMLGEGMAYDPASIAISHREEPPALEEPPAVTPTPDPNPTPTPKPTRTPKPTKTPKPTRTPEVVPAVVPAAEYQVIPGNHGFVLLVAALQAGDTLTFTAWAETETAVATVETQLQFAQANKVQGDIDIGDVPIETDGTRLLAVGSVGHALVIPPSPTPAPTPVPTEPPAQPRGSLSRNGQTAIVAIAALLLCITLTFIVRRLRRNRSGHNTK